MMICRLLKKGTQLFFSSLSWTNYENIHTWIIILILMVFKIGWHTSSLKLKSTIRFGWWSLSRSLSGNESIFRSRSECCFTTSLETTLCGSASRDAFLFNFLVDCVVSWRTIGLWWRIGLNPEFKEKKCLVGGYVITWTKHGSEATHGTWVKQLLLKWYFMMQLLV